MATAKIEVPHVITALGTILSSLAVQKNGTLPGNMGGKSYITAVDASAAVKALCVENDLAFVSNEHFIDKEIINDNGRKTVAITIRGEYTFVSTQDGSRETISGIGDGLAIGTAVASNIASTNALKNALLREFLITEQSVEDSAKNGTAGQGEPARATKDEARVAQARQPRQSPPEAPAEDGKTNYRSLIRGLIDSGKADKDAVNTRWGAISTELDKPKGSEEVMSKLYEEFNK